MDYMSSLDLAIKNEKTEAEFYLNQAERSKNAVAKEMFGQLAKEEEEHMELIKGLHAKLVAEKTWPEDVALQVNDTNVKKVLDRLTKKAGSAESHDDDDVKALKKAIEFEGKGSKFYAEMAQACKSKAEKNFFEFLSGIERQHQLSLTDSLSYLEDPEGWMMQDGKAGLDGA